MPGQNQGAKSQAQRVAKPLDLSAVQVRTRTMTGPKMMLRWNTKIGECTVLASRLFVDLSTQSGEGSVRPVNLAPYALIDESAPESEELGDIAVVPVQEKSLSTLGVKWYDKSTARIDLSRLFAARRFVVPQGQAAHIPVAVEDVPGVGKAVVIHFTQAWYAEVKPTGRHPKSQPPAAEGA